MGAGRPPLMRGLDFAKQKTEGERNGEHFACISLSVSPAAIHLPHQREAFCVINLSIYDKTMNCYELLQIFVIIL